VLVLHRDAVTVSSTGAENQFQVDDNGHVGRPCEVSLASPYPELFASYGASAVTRTSGRGHVAEATRKTNVSRRSVCLLLQDLLQSCSRGGEEESGGHVL
jgi:hypothetical protein